MIGLLPTPQAHLRAAEESPQRRRREECRRFLGAAVPFEDVELLVDNLGPLRREREVRDPTFRKAERARHLAEVWLWITSYVSIERGRASDWRRDVDAAIAQACC
jgi:hypothetical protein